MHGNGEAATTPWAAVRTTRIHTREAEGGAPQVHIWHLLQFQDDHRRILVEVGSSSGEAPDATAEFAALATHLRAAGWLPADAAPPSP